MPGGKGSSQPPIRVSPHDKQNFSRLASDHAKLHALSFETKYTHIEEPDITRDDNTMIRRLGTFD